MVNRVLLHRTEVDTDSDSHLYNGLPIGHEIPHPHPPTIHKNTKCASKLTIGRAYLAMKSGSILSPAQSTKSTVSDRHVHAIKRRSALDHGSTPSL